MVNTQNDLNTLKVALSRLPKGRRRRIPVDLRQRLAVYARRRMGEGASRLVVATELGVSDPTLVRALRQKSPPALAPVHVSEPEGAAGPITVRGPGGLTIEGLEMEDVVALLRGLAC